MFVEDIEADRTVLHLLALGIQQTVQLYYAQKGGKQVVDPEVMQDLRASIMLVQTLKANIQFFSGDVQEIIKLYF